MFDVHTFTQPDFTELFQVQAGFHTGVNADVSKSNLEVILQQKNTKSSGGGLHSNTKCPLSSVSAVSRFIQTDQLRRGQEISVIC